MGIPVVVSNAGFFAGTVSTRGGTTSLKLVNTGKTALYHHKITSPSNESTNEPSIKRNKSLDKLAPALDFLPIETESEGGVKGYTSEELVALEAYRAQYANYRLRESDGAHGERPSANPHVRGSLHEHEAKVRNGVGERYKTREHAPRSEAGSIKKLKLSDFVRFNKF
mmetsp:Transcript_26599/g.71378  ORF Transcript_26599/g.71378 Transcript_26599/m.71378 type:complete len:168 (+) Transcript_26599:548-1051(+)